MLGQNLSSGSEEACSEMEEKGKMWERRRNTRRSFPFSGNQNIHTKNQWENSGQEADQLLQNDLTFPGL